MAVTQAIQEQMLKEAYSATPNYSIDYNDPRFGKVESDKSQALTDLEQTYGGMIGQSDQFYNAQIQATQDWGAKQQQIQNEQTDFAIEQINQQKDQAHKDYLKEQSASYVDWQKQSNQYGANAEKMASAGLTDTGFAESSQVSMYNTYQNRVAVARESLSRAMLNYDNQITEARLQNNAALAEIAYQTLQQSLELSLAGFQYKNQLILEQANKKVELDNMYYNRYQDVLDQINHENAVKEDIRQYNETQKWQTEQAELDRNFKAQEAELDRKHSAAQAEIQRKFQAAEAELDRKHDKDLLAVKNQYEKERLEQQHKNDLAKLAKQQEYELAQLNKQLANEKALLSYKNSLTQQSYGSVSGGSSGGSSKKTSSSKSSNTHGGGGGSFGSVKTTTTSTKKTTSTGSLPINYKTLNAIGLSGVSETKLAKLVASGELLMYVKDGKRCFNINPNYYKIRTIGK
jgi:hypothetical protein